MQSALAESTLDEIEAAKYNKYINNGFQICNSDRKRMQEEMERLS
jgi:hypothetical protein